MPLRTQQEERVLVSMPGERDAERAVGVLREARLEGHVCRSPAELAAELTREAGAVLITNEALKGGTNEELEQALRAQPAWSLIPVLIVTHESAIENIQRGVLGGYPNLATIERPVRTRALIGALRAALRGRYAQYEVRDALREQERQSHELAAQDEKLRQALSRLNEQTEQLRTADRLKDEFLATLAHELRNPLAPITAGLSVLEMSNDALAQKRTLGIMRRQINHMVRLIDDLLDVSRITTGKLELKIQRFDVRSAIDAAVEASLPTLNRGRHTLTTNVSDDVMIVDGDHTRIAQIVSNLLNNAGKYTPSGGHIDLTVKREGENVEISVQDDGMGIPRDRLGDIFRMFGQVNRALDRSQGGLGIGLALVRRLVEMHRGRVEAHSEGIGKGSTFTVRLPAVEAVSLSRPEHAPPAGQESSAKRVLIVDDNEDAGEVLGLMLEEQGFEAVIVKDGPSAIEAASALTPNVVILDIGLPGMSGYEVAMRLRQDARFADTAMIALTGWGSPDDKRRAFDAGFDVHLTKPVFAEDLRRALSAVKPAT